MLFFIAKIQKICYIGLKRRFKHEYYREKRGGASPLSTYSKVLDTMADKTYNFSIMNHKSKNAFTLAEVLITLGIIGIVAALTIPTLINNYKKQTYITGLKKFYAEFSQVITMAKSDMNCSNTECMGFVGDINDPSWVNNMSDFVDKYFRSAKLCTDKYCEEDVYQVDGTYQEKGFTSSEFAFVSADGMFIKIMPRASASLWNSITVDVNGNKGPNTIGRDIHLFRLSKEGKFYPYYGYDYASSQGGAYSSHLHWKTNESLCGWDGRPFPSRSTGYGCTARIIESSWQMNY